MKKPIKTKTEGRQKFLNLGWVQEILFRRFKKLANFPTSFNNNYISDKLQEISVGNTNKLLPF